MGGGVAGLTVAHELSRFPGEFAVTVYEQNDILGGKARSVRLPDQNVGEHAMRVFMASYATMYNTMQEIPYRDGLSTYDNLVYGTFALNNAGAEAVFDARTTSALRQVVNSVRLADYLRDQGVPEHELADFFAKLGKLLIVTEEQAQREIAAVSFEQYMEADRKSDAFRRIILRLPEILVAAKRKSDAYVVSRTMLEFFVGPFLKSNYHRLGFASLNGPTSERFIDPWVRHLMARDVSFRTGTKITAISNVGPSITGLTTATGEEIRADLYVIAIQHNVLDALLTPSLRAALPAFDFQPLGEEWSNGVQYFLRSVPPDWEKYRGRVTMKLDSPWSIVFMIHDNASIWRGVPLPAGTAAIVSAVASNGFELGRRHQKPFPKCTAAEMLEEVLVQCELNGHPDAVIAGYVGPDLEYVTRADLDRDPARYTGYAISPIDGTDQLVACDSQLYIRAPGNIDAELPNVTPINNLFLAGEFTKTNFMIPTMEKSNESGRRCAQAICERVGLLYDSTRLAQTRLPFEAVREIRGWLLDWTNRIGTGGRLVPVEESLPILRSFAETEDEFTKVVTEFAAKGNPLGYHAALHLSVLRRLRAALDAGRFLDRTWVERAAVEMGNRYFTALAAHLTDRLPPASWRVAFEAADRPGVTLLQHVVLSVNAQLNLDLVVALTGGLPGARTLQTHLPDFSGLLDVVFETLIGPVQQRINQFSPLMDVLDRVGARASEVLFNFSLKTARQESQENALLLDGRREGERRSTCELLDRRAAELARRILDPGVILGSAAQIVSSRESRDVGSIVKSLGGG